MKEDMDIGNLIREIINQMDHTSKGIMTGYYYNQLSIKELAQIYNTDQIKIYKILNESRNTLIESLKNMGVAEDFYPAPLSIGTEIFLSYGEGAIQSASLIQKKGIQQ